LALAHGVRGGLPMPYDILCVGGGAVTSILGAVFLDLHRRAIFHQRVLLERRRDEQLATLYDVTRTVAATLELQDVLRLVCQSMLHALGVERLWLFWRESPDRDLRAHAAERRDDQVVLTDLHGDPARWEPLLRAGASRVPALLEPTGEEIAAHGGTCQALMAIKLDLVLLERQLPADAAALHGSVRDVRDQVLDVMHSVRQMSHLLHPPVLDDSGAVAAIESIAEKYRETSGPEVRVDCSDPAMRF